MSFEKKINELGLTLPEAKAPVGNYVATKITNKLLFISGQISIDENGGLVTSQVKAGMLVIQLLQWPTFLAAIYSLSQ